MVGVEVSNNALHMDRAAMRPGAVRLKLLTDNDAGRLPLHTDALQHHHTGNGSWENLRDVREKDGNLYLKSKNKRSVQDRRW